MNELLLHDLIRAVSITVVLAAHALILLYGAEGGQRGHRTAIAHLVAIDWALMMGVTAGRSLAGDDVPFWSLHTMAWGILGLVLLCAPAWLLLHLGLGLSSVFLLPVLPTDRDQCAQAGRALQTYAWGLNRTFYREEEDSDLVEVVEGARLSGSLISPPGGPGLVIASNHYAVPLTVGTRDTRVGGHGLVFTGRGERPRELVDLRPQSGSKEIHALTRDGIPVKAKVSAKCQIDHRKAKGDWLYPFDPEAVFAAIHAQAVGPDQDEEEALGWDQIVVDRAANLFQDAIAQTLLDRLLSNDDEDGGLSFKALTAQAKKDLIEAMAPHGIEVLGAGVGNVAVEDEDVHKQWVENWKANWERRRVEREAQREAEATRLLERARADVQGQMMEAIIEALQQLADADMETQVRADVIALRFIDVLEDVAASPPLQEKLPERVQSMPTQLRLLLERAATGDDHEEVQ